MMPPPSKEQLVGASRGPDEQCVISNFLGLDQSEAQELFHVSATLVTEDFSYMAPAGLRYYLGAAFLYLLSKRSSGNYDFCHGLLCSLSSQIRSQAFPEDLLQTVKEVAAYCDQERAKFGIAPIEDLFDGYCLEIYRKTEAAK